MKTISAKNAHDHWGDVLSEVYFGKEEMAVERKGRVEAVVIHPETYTKLTGKTLPETPPAPQPPTVVPVPAVQIASNEEKTPQS